MRGFGAGWLINSISLCSEEGRDDVRHLMSECNACVCVEQQCLSLILFSFLGPAVSALKPNCRTRGFVTVWPDSFRSFDDPDSSSHLGWESLYSGRFLCEDSSRVAGLAFTGRWSSPVIHISCVILEGDQIRRRTFRHTEGDGWDALRFFFFLQHAVLLACLKTTVLLGNKKNRSC